MRVVHVLLRGVRHPAPRARALAPFLVLLLLPALAAAPAVAVPCIVSATCADGDLCNGVERCVGGQCQPVPPLACEDGDPCTRDYCEAAAGCVHAEDRCPADCAGLPDGTRCRDGSVCTRGDTCVAGTCVPGAAGSCDDGDACTRDTCDPLYGCVYREEAVAFPCVPDCNGGVADYTRCPGDDDICTIDACLPSVDLIGDPHRCIVGLLGLERPCVDADVCNGQEFCSPLLGCEPGPPPVCDDGELCNGSESCDPALGCRPGSFELDGTACDDRKECTSGDACAGGACVGTPLPPAACDDGDAQTVDVCEEGFGCVHCRGALLGKLNLRGRPGEGRRITVRGVLPVLAPGSIAPATEQVGIVVEAGTTTFAQAVLPPGALEGNALGTRFRYHDPAAAVDGVRALKLQALGGALRWRLVADLEFPAVLPPSATVRLVVGRACFEAAASCSGPARNVTCR